MEGMNDKNEKKYDVFMAELSEIMKHMETPGISLEDQIKSYEKGMELVGVLNGILRNAEEKIMIINNKGQEERFE